MDNNKMKSEPIKTVLTITVGMLLVYVYTKWQWAFNVSMIVGVSGLLSSFLARKIEFVWFKLTWVLSLAMPNIILSIVFYLLLTPIALLSNLFGEKNQLFLKNSSDTLFNNPKTPFDKRFFEKPW